MKEFANETRVYRFGFDGSEYEIPAYNTLPVSYLENLFSYEQQGKTAEISKEVVRQLIKVLPDELKGRMSQGTLSALAQDWATSAGVTPGESDTSSD